MPTPDQPGPKLEVSEAVVVESEIVGIAPGMAPGYVELTAYRADGRPFIRVHLPEEAAKVWTPFLEHYAQKHDITRQPKFLKLEP